MKKSYKSILLLFLVMILAMSAVSAADADDTSDSDLQAVDEVAVDEVASADVDDVVSTDSAADVVADPGDGNNFTSLQDSINAIDYNPNIQITKDIVRVAGDSEIIINKTFVHIYSESNNKIDAKSLGGIFKINPGCTLMLKGITLVNGVSEKGGAIYNEGTLLIDDCEFNNNTASVSGGVIYDIGNLLDIGTSTFEENSALLSGGAIYSTGKVTITDSEFKTNKVTNGYEQEEGSQGGAIYAIGDELKISDSSFIGNTANPNDHGEGAAIYAEVTTTTISGTTFKSNKGFQGGAVKLIGVDQDTLVFNNCTFDSNIALQGGAIDAQGCANLRINDTLFIDNQAYSDRYSGLNPDMGAAAAIGAAYVNDIVIYVNNSKFIHNTVTSGPTENSGFGAAIISTGSLIVDNTEFTDNEADKFATLRVYHNGNAGTVTITNSNFTGNKANKGDAAVLYASASKTTTIDNCRFEDNTAAGNGVIYADGALNVKNSYFKNNIANNTANAIYANNALTLSGNTIDGGAAEIIANGEVNSQINVTILNNGTVDTYADSVTVNATITDDKGNLIADAKGFKFVVNGAEANATYDAVNKIYTGTLTLPGPGIYTVNITYTEQDKLKVKTATINNYRGTFRDLNKTIANGQDLQYDFKYTPELGDDVFVNGIEINTAVTINGNGHTISGSNAARIFNVTASLTLTNVTLTNGKADNGGAIYVANGATLDADYANFTDNTATYKGGAVYSEGDVKVNHTVFDNNNITKNDGTSENNYGGAAIYNVDGALTVDNSVIKNNQKDYKYGITEDNGDKVGGVITTTGTVRITNSNFTGNKGRWGSSITMVNLTSNTVASIIIDNCNFTDNIAYQGGAVQFTDLELEFTINNCWFENNAAFGKGSGKYTANGGALSVFISQSVGKGTINGTTFINNQVQDVSVRVPDKYLCGGAVVLDGKSFTVENSVFINNFAEKGSAIHIVDGRLTVDNVTFDSNEATVGGAAIWAFDNIDVKNSRFINNNATEGGAIYFSKYATSSTVNNSNFTDNKAVNGGAIYITEEDKVKHLLPAVTITDSKFDGNTATGEGNAIYNLGKLTLARNTLSKEQADIVSNGEVASTIIIVVMNNGTAYHFANITLQANVTDDNYNPMEITGLNLTVNDTANTQLSVKYNPATGLHEGTYTPIEVGKFNIGATYITTTAQLDITTANITIAKSLIDIQDMIDAASAGDTINLTGDYAYIEEFDKTIVNGIVVNKNITIDGKGKTISGSDLARLFNVTAPYTLTLTNVTLTKGKADEGAAVYVDAGAKLDADYVNFVNNTAVKKGGAIYSEGIVEIDHSVFDENTITDRKVDYSLNHGGAAIYNYDGTLTVNNTKFINHVKGYSTADERIDGTITTSGTTKIYNSVFENNSARYGTDICAIPIPITTGTQTISLTVDGCNFTTSTTFAGAIQVQKANVVIKDCIFNESTASGVPTTGYTAAGAAICAMANSDVTISGSQFNNMIGPKGGAILAQDIKKINISNTNFTNCIATGTGSSATKGYGGAVFLERVSEESTIEGCVFKDNSASYGGAVAIVGAQATVKDSNFTNNHATNGSSIYNEGTLALSGNNVTSGEAEIESLGTITSTIKVIILNGEVKTINTLEANLSAKVTDDNGNLIKDAKFNFTINSEEVKAVYNASSKLYEATYTLPVAGIYPVNITYVTDNKLEVKNATVKSTYGTFTQLQQLINNTAEDSTLVLPYNFTYNAEIDGDAFIAGVVIDKSMTVDGNGSTISGADAARIFQLNANNINITNTTFTNGYSNTSSTKTADWGGAIYSNAPCQGHVMSDCKFYNNTAYKGGAIYLGSDASEIVACEFEDNNANASGGAVLINGLADTISDSTFKFNMANELGGAVACYSTQQGAEIKNSVFIGNIAFANGGAIALYGDATITQSEFTKNTAQNYGGAIFVDNNATLDITKSTIKENTATLGSSIYVNNGTVESTIINATLIGGQNIAAALGEEVTPNATLTDDNGNSIYDPNFNITVNGNVLETSYDEATNLYTATYTIADAGDNVVSTNYDATITPGKYEVEKANATLTVTVDDIIDGENATVFVTLTGVNGIGLNDTVTVIVNNKEYPIVVTNGTGNETIENLTHGSYPVVAMLNESANYNKAINSTVFYVKATTTIVIEGPADNVTYGEPVTIKVTVTTSDNQPFNGLIHLGYYETDYDVVIHAGEGSYTFDANTYFLGKGEHEFIAVYDGNNDYNASASNRISFNVTAKQLNETDVGAIIYGDAPGKVNVTIYGPKGDYNVTIDGNVYHVEVGEEGIGSIEITDLTAGEKEATIVINDENYNGTITETFDYRLTPAYDVTFNGTYPNLEITIEGVNGTYTVYVGDDYKVNITVKDGKATETITGISAGTYEIVGVSFNGTDLYKVYYRIYEDVVVAQATPVISVVANEATYPANVIVTVTSDVAGTYTVKVGDKSKEVTLKANVASDVTFEGLNATETGHAIEVTYEETENYTAAVNNTEKVIVKKGTVVFNATVTTPVAYPNDVIVTVNTTVAGKVTIEGNPHVFYVEAGVTDLPISDLSVGTYSSIIVHFEADNYNAADDDITFEVTKGTPEFNVTAVVAKDTYPGAVTIIVTSDINAKFNVTVGDETKEVEVTNGIGYETFTGVAADIDNATVTFIEDTHYKETSKVEKFTAIAKSAPEFSVTPVLIVDTYKGKVNITISGVDGTYSIQIKDVGTNALLIRGEIIVSGGKGSKVFENLTAGDKEVTATIDESANYTAGEGFATFTVKKATIEIEPKATGEFIVDGKINVTFKLPTDIDGTVIVYVDGVADPQAPTSVEGVYTIEFDAFNAGSHTFVATLTGDSNYADAMGQTTFDVEKVNVTISIAPDNSVPNPESILIKVADNATGTILVEIPGYLTLQNYEIENGTYTLDLGSIPADDYEIFVTYMGDDKYNNASADATFTIVKLASPEVIVNITDTAIVGEKDVVVNITVGDNFANPGNVTVYVDGIPVQTVAIDEYGNVIVTVPALENGTHTIGVKYNGNNYFNASDIVNKTVTVTQAASSVTIDPIDNVTYGKTVVIKYTIVNETDYVTIQVADETGKTYEITVEDGVITVEGIIPAGKYTVSIHNGESGFYTESEANATFYVTEGPKIDIKVAENTTAPTFNITLPEDATGYVLVDVDGKQYYAPLVNGSASIQTEPLAGGNHTVNVTYTGDSKYPGFSNSTNVTIDSNITADSAFDIPTSTETSSPTFSINLPSDATGYLLVDVDGKKYAAVVENGTASITVPGLSEGNHNITVSYTGDGKYPALSKDATVNVHIPVYKITENKNINVLYSASASYKVLITKDGKAVGAGETVTIKYNGKTYNVKTDSKGYATLKLSTKVKVKSYTITATYQGVSVKNTVKVKHVIKASNKKVKKSRKVTKIKITLRKVNNKYLAKKTIKVKFKGKTYKVKTNKKGVATWKVKKSMVKKLKVGKKYKYRVTYGKDVLTKKLTIKR